MRWIVFGMLVVICLLMLIGYALLVMAHEADEKAERMYRKWIEANRGLVDSLKADTICAQNLKTSKWKESKDGRFDKTE